MPLAAEPLESRTMLATTATLSGDISFFARIPVIHGSRPANPAGNFVGQFSWSSVSGAAAAVGLSAPFKSFCIEGQQSISPGKHEFPTLKPIAASGLTNAGLVEQFWRHYGPATPAGFTNATDAAAFQLGIWELIGDGRPTQNAATFALANGNFKVGSSTAPAVARAASWLNAWSNGTATQPVGGAAVSLYVLQHPTKQDQVVWVPAGVDLDVDSDNPDAVPDPANDPLDRSAAEEAIEADPTRPGVIVPVGGSRAKMIVDVPQGRTATLEFDAGSATKVRVYSPSGAVALEQGRLSTPIVGGPPQTFWIEAFAPSVRMADIAFTLTTTGSGPASSDTVFATAVAVDLDVDSNNDGRVDPVNEPDGTDDPIEHAPTRGLVVPVYAGDADADGLNDTLDFNGINGRRFAPVKVRLSTGAAYAWTNPIRPSGSPAEDLPGLTFTFTFSDAGLVPAAAGLFRLWKKDAPFVRKEADLIRTGVPIAATELFAGAHFTTPEEYLSTYGTATLYLEAVSPSPAYEPITVRMGGTGAWANAGAADTVHARALKAVIDLDVDSNNDEGFDVPQQRSEWENKLESHPYAIGKLVMQSSSSVLGDNIAEDRLAANFTPVVIELPKNLPLDAHSIGIEFTTGLASAVDGGEIRLWTRDKGPGLRWEDAAGQPHPLMPGGVFGDRVNFDKPYTLSQINYDPTTGVAVLYIDGHVSTKKVTLHDVEQRGRFQGILQATLTFDAPNARLSLADDSIQYMVVRDDFFYHDLQFGSVGLGSTGSQVRSALASRGVYSYADLPTFALKRLTTQRDKDSPPGELQEILELDPNSETAAMLYNDADTPATPTAYPGFKVVLYQDYAAVADNTFVLAFGGTDDQLGLVFDGNMPELADWVENIGQGLGWRIAEYRWAMDVARAVDDAVKRKTGDGILTMTGHSLGGGLASAASVVTGATGVTFNAAGLHKNSLRMYFENDPVELAVALARYQQPDGLVFAYWVDQDFLSNFQDRYRLFVSPALGDRQKLDGPYDFAALTIQAIDAAFDTAALAPAVGTLVKLGVDLAAKAGTGYLMVRAHSMDAVLYGLLVEEHRFTTNRDLLGYPTSRFL